MVSVARIIAPPNSKSEPVHYHLITSNITQSRFARLIVLSAIVAYVLSLFQGLFASIGWFWWILPIRALPIFASGFLVHILRKQQIRVISLRYPNAAAEWAGRIVSARYSWSLATYLCSAAAFFCLIRFQISDMSVTKKIRTYEPPTLNERVVYVNLFTAYLAIIYSVVYTIMEFDFIHFPVAPKFLPPRVRLAAQKNKIVIIACAGALCATFSFPIVYLFMRRAAWNVSLAIVRKFVKLHRSTAYVSFPGTSPSMLWHCFFGSFLLILWWQFCNTAFTIYLSLGPRHRGTTFSEESSDKNGTLITGLKASIRPYTQVLAFHELMYIAITDKARRVTIFKDIDRDPASIWRQISKECLSVVNAMNKKFEKPAKKPTQRAPQKQAPAAPPRAVHLSVKRDENIFASKEQGKRLVDNFQDKQAERSTEVIGFVSQITSVANSYIQQYSLLVTRFLETPVGAPFRCTIERDSISRIPNEVLVNCAITSLSELVVHSIEDDDYGIVHRDVGQILSTLYETIKLLEDFLLHPPVHWTDVLVVQERREPNLTRIVRILRLACDAFYQIVDAYRDTINEISLSDEVLHYAIQIFEQQQNQEYYGL
ncbi:hypothetical protein TRVA0_014S02300 [Trichomonascus vanleenenianus]|uniref:Ndc1p n=1 Tax=Trichomonascus vanleenenianus TaxID=2268995 RepID=UPI003ECB3E8C